MSLRELYDERQPLYEKYAGITVNVDDLSINVFTGKMSLGGLRIGNPEGFNTESLFTLKSVDVAVVVSLTKIFGQRHGTQV